MTAKEYLIQIQKADRLIQRLMSTVATLRSGLIIQNYELKPDKVQAAGSKNVLEEVITKIVDLEADINNRIDELVQQKADAISRIRNISDRDQQNILIARYVNGVKWEKIALELNFSMRKQSCTMFPPSLEPFRWTSRRAFPKCLT